MRTKDRKFRNKSDRPLTKDLISKSSDTWSEREIPKQVTMPTNSEISFIPQNELNVPSKVKSLHTFYTPDEYLEDTAVEYPLLNRENDKINFDFSGDPSITGNIIQSAVLLDNTIFDKYFDGVRFTTSLNYMFLNTSNANSLYGQNIIYKNTFWSVLSTLGADMYRMMTFYSSVGTSTIPGIGSSTESSDARVAAWIDSQMHFQNLMLLLQKHVSSTKLRNTMFEMCYKKGQQYIRELFFQLGKSVYKAKLDAIAKHIGDNFVDYDWFKLISGYTEGCSRRSNSVSDPLLSQISYYEMPTVTLHDKDVHTNWYDSNTRVSDVSLANPINGANNRGETQYSVYRSKNIGWITRAFNKLMDPVTIVHWARSLANGNKKTIDVQSYYNNLVNLITAALSIIDKMNSQLTPLNEFMVIARQAGLLKWKQAGKNNVFTFNSEPEQPKYNVFIHDLLTNIHSGMDSINWDAITNSWYTATLWDRTSDMPDFDKNTGGIIFSASVKGVTGVSSMYGDMTMLLPKLFNVSDQSASTFGKDFYDQDFATTTINRNSNSYGIGTELFDTSKLKKSEVLSCLLIKDSSVLASNNLKVPKVTTAVDDPAIVSSLSKMIQTVFKLGMIVATAGINATYTYINPTLVGIVDVILRPVSVSTQNFIYVNCPLTSNGYAGDSDLGLIKKN